jgi:hypothetical protein
MAMNANKRIEEFMLKLSIRQNNLELSDMINELKTMSHLNHGVINEKKHSNISDTSAGKYK